MKAIVSDIDKGKGILNKIAAEKLPPQN